MSLVVLQDYKGVQVGAYLEINEGGGLGQAVKIIIRVESVVHGEKYGVEHVVDICVPVEWQVEYAVRAHKERVHGLAT